MNHLFFRLVRFFCSAGNFSSINSLTITPLQDDGNCIFDSTISVPDMSHVNYEFDLDLEIPFEPALVNNRFVDNEIIYISGFIMRKIVDKETCMYCYTYLTENKQRVSCELIKFKQLGGLVYPIFDVVAIVHISNRALDSALKQSTLCDVLKCGKNITNEIVAEILSSESTILQEIVLHDEEHRLRLLKTIVFSFISLKGKHLCSTHNIESSTMTRHKNTKQVLFLHE